MRREREKRRRAREEKRKGGEERRGEEKVRCPGRGGGIYSLISVGNSDGN
jgi:hypothetical protein